MAYMPDIDVMRTFHEEASRMVDAHRVALAKQLFGMDVQLSNAVPAGCIAIRLDRGRRAVMLIHSVDEHEGAGNG